MPDITARLIFFSLRTTPALQVILYFTLAAIGFLHELVVESVAGLFVFGGPDDCLGGVGEIAAGEVGRRVGLDPGDVVEEFKIELLHSEADAVDDVGGAGDPDGAVGFEDALARG